MRQIPGIKENAHEDNCNKSFIYGILENDQQQDDPQRMRLHADKPVAAAEKGVYAKQDAQKYDYFQDCIKSYDAKYCFFSSHIFPFYMSVSITAAFLLKSNLQW